MNRGQPQSPLPCHHVILVASIGVASTPGRENARASFWGRLGVWNRTAPDRRQPICSPWRQRSWSCGVFKSWISDAQCPFQWKWQVLHNYDISVLQQVGMFLDGIACLMKVWLLFKREFPRVPMTWRSARARANFKCDVADLVLSSCLVYNPEMPTGYCRDGCVWLGLQLAKLALKWCYRASGSDRLRQLVPVQNGFGGKWFLKVRFVTAVHNESILGG